MPGPDGRPLQVMSGATIDEQRVDLQGTMTLPTSVVDSAITLGASTEDDYRSLHGGVEVTREDDDKMTSLTGGLSYYHDRLEPTEGDRKRTPLNSHNTGATTIP